MGQIWERISRLAKTYLNDTSDTSTAERILRSDDDELKRIIDELDNTKHTPHADSEQKHSEQKHSEQKHSEQKQYSQEKQHYRQNTEQQQSQQKQRPRTSPGAMTLVKAATVLDVRTDASVSEIKTAYKKKVLKFHPDRMAHASHDEQAQSKQIIVEVNQAYQFFQQLKGF